MMVLKLFYTFVKIGLFSFGGGYAILPFLQQEFVNSGLMDMQRYMSMVAISQMTPGPIAVNAATFVGWDVAGILGALACTVGVSLPAFFLVILAAKFFKKYEDKSITQNTLRGIRAVAVGLMFSAVWSFIVMSMFGGEIHGWASFNWKTVPIAILGFVLSVVKTKKFHIGPIGIVVLSAVLGIVLL
mgnify:CR=1 FL=1